VVLCRVPVGSEQIRPEQLLFRPASMLAAVRNRAGIPAMKVQCFARSCQVKNDDKTMRASASAVSLKSRAAIAFTKEDLLHQSDFSFFPPFVSISAPTKPGDFRRSDLRTTIRAALTAEGFKVVGKTTRLRDRRGRSPRAEGSRYCLTRQESTDGR